MDKDITKIPVASLAAWYFDNLQHDFAMEWEETQRLDAEVKRRGLTIDQLAKARDGARLDVVPEEKLKQA